MDIVYTESDEELIRKVENVLYGKHKSIQDEKNGNVLDLKTGEIVTQKEMNRYDRLMKKRNNEDNSANSGSPSPTDDNYDYNYFNIDKSWTKTIRPQDTKFLDRIKKKLSDKEILKDEEIQRLKEIKDNNPDLISFMRYHSIRKYLESQTLKDNVNKPLTNTIKKSEDKKEDEKEGTNNKFLERLRHDMAERIKIMYNNGKQKVNANHSSDKYKDESVKENQPSINGDKNKLEEEMKEYEILIEEKLRRAEQENKKYREEINMLRNKLKESEELVKNLRRQSEQVNNNNHYNNQIGYYLPPNVVQTWY